MSKCPQVKIMELEAQIAEIICAVSRSAEALNKMLHKEPDSDFTDIDDVIFDLEGIAGTRPELVLEARS